MISTHTQTRPYIFMYTPSYLPMCLPAYPPTHLPPTYRYTRMMYSEPWPAFGTLGILMYSPQRDPCSFPHQPLPDFVPCPPCPSRKLVWMSPASWQVVLIFGGPSGWLESGRG